MRWREKGMSESYELAVKCMADWWMRNAIQNEYAEEIERALISHGVQMGVRSHSERHVMEMERLRGRALELHRDSPEGQLTKRRWEARRERRLIEKATGKAGGLLKKEARL